MPRRLVIDTATPMLSIALFDDDVLIAHHHALIGRGHAELLVPAIAALPDGGRCQAIMVGCGPGSFTGIRIAIAAARALALAWGAALSGFDTLALMAAAARDAHGLPDATPIAVASDGGHGEWFVADAPGAACALSPAIAAQHVTQHHVAGPRSHDLVALRGWGAALGGEADARAILRLHPAAITVAVRPFYGRAPDAAVKAGL